MGPAGGGAAAAPAAAAMRTIEAKSHLCLEHLEVVRHARLGLGAHFLAGPLEGTVEFLSEIHLVCVLSSDRSAVCFVYRAKKGGGSEQR